MAAGTTITNWFFWRPGFTPARGRGGHFSQRHRQDSDRPGPIPFARARGGLQPLHLHRRVRRRRHPDQDVQDEPHPRNRYGYGHRAGGAIAIDVAHELQKHGMQFYVNTEIGSLSVGSACCAGTKDASMPGEYGQVGSYITSIKMVLPSGELLEASDQQPDLM